ncbi:MAG: hypothetical protein AAF899_15345 [Pseudomonadota bacterium]
MNWLRSGWLGAVILAAALVLPGVASPVAQWFHARDTRVQAALISVTGTLVSALTGVLVFNMQAKAREDEIAARQARERKDERKRREELDKRMAAALRSEISASVDRLVRSFDPAENEALIRGMRRNLEQAAEGERGMPVGVALRENKVFEDQGSDLYHLPEGLLRAVVRYYQNDSYLTLYFEQMAEGHFDPVNDQRRRKAIRHYVYLGERALYTALIARAGLDMFMADEPLPNELSESIVPEHDRALLDRVGLDHVEERFAVIGDLLGIEEGSEQREDGRQGTGHGGSPTDQWRR